MSKSYVLEHCASATESVLVETAAKSEMTRTFQGVDPTDPTGQTQMTEYTLNSGDSAYPATVTYRNVTRAKGGDAVRRFSLTFQTWATETESVTGEVRRKPVSAQINFSLPVSFSVELADLDDMLGNLFSFMYASQSSGARATGYLSVLQFGGTQVV